MLASSATVEQRRSLSEHLDSSELDAAFFRLVGGEFIASFGFRIVRH